MACRDDIIETGLIDGKSLLVSPVSKDRQATRQNQRRIRQGI